MKKIVICVLFFIGSLSYADSSVINKTSIEDIKKEELSNQSKINSTYYKVLAYDRANAAILDAQEVYDTASANNASIVAGDNSVNIIIQEVIGDTIAVGR